MYFDVFCLAGTKVRLQQRCSTVSRQQNLEGKSERMWLDAGVYLEAQAVSCDDGVQGVGLNFGDSGIPFGFSI